MTWRPKIALIGAGNRAKHHLSNVYVIRNQSYIGRKPEDSHLHQPQALYHEYAARQPDWTEDISELQPIVTAIFDPDEEARRSAQTVCRNHDDDPTLYGSFDALYEDREYDTVIVASPNHTHVDAVLSFLERGVNVFSEKPLATTLADHDRLIEADERSESLFYIGFNMRHSPLYRRLRDLIHDGAVGRLGMITAHEVRTPFPPGHYYSREESGGSLLEKVCHDFDMFNWIIEADPVKVAAFGGQHVFSENTDVLDHATVIIRYDNGVKATLELCLHAPFGQSRDRVYSVRGSDGIIRTPDESATWELFTRNTHDRFTALDTSGGHGGADVSQMKSFLHCLYGEEERSATPTDAKKAAAIALGAQTAIDEDAVVNIDSAYDIQY